MSRGGYIGGSTLWTGREMNTPADYTDKSGPNGQSRKSMGLLASEDPLLKALGMQLADIEIMTASHLAKRVQVTDSIDLDFWHKELQALTELKSEVETVIETLNLKNRRRARHYVRTDPYRRLESRLWDAKRDYRTLQRLRRNRTTS